MENHYPTITASAMFSDSGPNSPGRFCQICDLRIEHPIHRMLILKENEPSENEYSGPSSK